VTVSPLAVAAAALPGDWSTVPLKHLAQINARTLPENTPADQVLDYIDISAVDSLGNIAAPTRMAFAEAPSRARRVVRGGDILVSTVRTYLRAIARVPEEGDGWTASTGFAVVTPFKGVDRSYLYWCLRSDPFVEEVVAQSVGVSYPAINASDVARLRIPLPPYSVQKRMADYLDRECARIDELIAEQQQTQGALLREHLAGELVHTVLPAEPPKGWADTRLKYLFEFERNGIWGDEPSGTDDDVTCVRVADFDRVSFRAGTGATTIRSVPANQRVPRLLRAGDILLEKSGGTDDKPVGCAVTFDGDQPSVCSNFVAQLRPRPQHNARYLGMLMAALYTARRNGPFVKQTTGIQNLDSHEYLGQHVAVPSRREQDGLVDHLERNLDLTLRTLSELDQQVRLLREHKQALITAVVTGQKEVA